MNGTFKSVNGQVVCYQKADGTSGTQVVDANATITLNGNTVKLTDLKDGDHITFGGNPSTSVIATR